MGGSVGLTIREPDGTEHRTCRWTNILPWAIKNMRLVNKDPGHIKAILKIWEEMRADYERNKGSGNFEIEMTGCYAPYPFLAPMNYGLVVVDMVNNEILDYQGYTDLSCVDSVGMRDDAASNPNDDEDNYVRFCEFFNAKKISAARDYIKKCDVDIAGKTLEEVTVLLASNRDLSFSLDMSPFKLTQYKDRDSEDAQLMKLKLKELGFELSDEEKRIWADWIKKEYQ